MQRRTLIAVPGAVVLAAVLPAAGAPDTRVFRVGLLNALPPKTPLEEEGQKAFSDELLSRGWVEGTNLQLLRRYTLERPGATAELAAELLAAKVDVIVVFGEDQAAAVRRVTTTTPIVFTHGVAPVELGLVASLARPGGNVTGVANQGTTLATKQIELARLMRPDIKRVAVIWFPASPMSALVFKQQKGAIERMGFELVSLPIAGSAEWDQALANVLRSDAQMLTAHLAPFVVQRIGKPFADWTIEHRIVTFFGAEHGFLMSYFSSAAETQRMAAGYVDRILRGAKPAELPVEQVNRFRLVINARTAKAMGLTIPRELLARADEVIQ